jgi:hypothetical protein
MVTTHSKHHGALLCRIVTELWAAIQKMNCPVVLFVVRWESLFMVESQTLRVESSNASCCVLLLLSARWPCLYKCAKARKLNFTSFIPHLRRSRDVTGLFQHKNSIPSSKSWLHEDCCFRFALPLSSAFGTFYASKHRLYLCKVESLERPSRMLDATSLPNASYKLWWESLTFLGVFINTNDRPPRSLKVSLSSSFVGF